MKILFDTNLWISFMIGKRLASLADVLCDLTDMKQHAGIPILKFTELTDRLNTNR